MTPVAIINKPVYKIAPSDYQTNDPEVGIGSVIIDASNSYDPLAGPSLEYRWFFLRNDGESFTRLPGPRWSRSDLTLNFDFLFNAGFGNGVHYLELVVEGLAESEPVLSELIIIGASDKIEPNFSVPNTVVKEGEVAAQTMISATISPGGATLYWPNTQIFCASGVSDVPGMTFEYNWYYGLYGSTQCVTATACIYNTSIFCTVAETLTGSFKIASAVLWTYGRNPTANIPVASYTVYPNGSVTLKATGSTVGCNTYRWTFGSVTAYGYTFNLTYDQALASGGTSVTLTVTDCQNVDSCYFASNSGSDTVPLVVAPRAEANGPYTITSSGLRLDGTGSSTRSGTKYEWYIPQIVGSSTSFAMGIHPTPNAPWTGLFPMSYALNNRGVQLKVLYSGLTASDTASLFYEPNCPSIDENYPFSQCNLYGNQAPIASPNGPYEVFKNGNIQWFISDVALPGLDATGSYDPDGGGIQSYAWRIKNLQVYDISTPITPTISWTDLRNLGYSKDSSYAVSLEVVDNDILNVTGDTLGELSDWQFTISSIRHADMDYAAWYTWYWNIDNNGLLTTVRVFKNSARTQQVAQGTVNWANGGTVILSGVNGSTLSGQVNVIASSHFQTGGTLFYSTGQASTSLTIFGARNPDVTINGPYNLAIINRQINTTVITDSAVLSVTAVSPDGDPLFYNWVLLSGNATRAPGGPWALSSETSVLVTYNYLHNTLNLPHNANVAIPFDDYIVRCTVTAGNVYPGDATPTTIITQRLTLWNTEPIVDANGPYTLLQWKDLVSGHGTVILADTGTMDLDGTIQEWAWKIGSDTVSTLQNPTLTWGGANLPPASDTPFDLNLFVRDNDGILSSDIATLIYQPNHAPVCSISSDSYSVNAGSSVTLSGSATDVDTNDFITSWEWAVYRGSDTEILTTSASSTFTYGALRNTFNLQSGQTYNLTFTARDRAGLAGHFVTTLTMGANQPPIAVITSRSPNTTIITMLTHSIDI